MAIEEVFTGFGDKETMEREEALDKLAIETFQHYRLHEHIELLCPQVLVRVLPRDYYVGNIYIPDTKESNKPVYEGITVRTWRPKKLPGKNPGDFYEIRSELKPGDHVLFPHFAGQPIPGLNQDRYRSVPEGITRNGKFIFGNDVGCIFAKVDYKRYSVEELFNDIFEDCPEGNAEELLRQLLDNFDMAVKVKRSVTKSGN